MDHFNQPTRFTGGSGILVENPELRPFAKRFSIFLILSSLLLALIFALIYSSLTFLALALLGSALAWYYSAPPLKLSYKGLGEISTILSGFILPTFGYVAMTGYIDLKIVLFAIPFMIYMLFFILSVEIPDMEGDKKGNKNTFIVKKGRKTGFILIGLSGVLGTLSLFFLSYSGIYSQITFKMIIMASLIPLIVGLNALIRRTDIKDAATRLVNLNIPALVIFILLLDIYFLSLILNIKMLF